MSPRASAEARTPATLEESLATLGHRERLLAGMATSIKERGFRQTTVADVVRIARTSRRTFYEHFADREDCFLALGDVLADISMRRIADAVDPAMPWEEQVDRALDAYLRLTMTEPQLVHSFVHETAGIGERGLAHQRAAIDGFADLLVRLVDEGRATDPSVPPLPQETALLFVAGMRELITRAVEQDRDLLELRPVIADALKAVLKPGG